MVSSMNAEHELPGVVLLLLCNGVTVSVVNLFSKGFRLEHNDREMHVSMTHRVSALRAFGYQLGPMLVDFYLLRVTARCPPVATTRWSCRSIHHLKGRPFTQLRKIPNVTHKFGRIDVSRRVLTTASSSSALENTAELLLPSSSRSTTARIDDEQRNARVETAMMLQ